MSMGACSRLPAFFAIALFTAICVPGTASACFMPVGWTSQQGFTKAALVFRGLVTATELSPTKLATGPADTNDGRILVNVRYEIAEVFKGKPEANGVISTTTLIMGGCGVPVLAGQSFLFYVDALDEEAQKAEPEFAKQTQGMISIYDSQMLPPNPQLLDEALAEVRAFAKKH
ncbi:hypothetical protein [Mesorhizobium sp. B2-4-6]|uniref:hypothetical protein n=1 Tax=Mesorhizobium sp. B2-4-6 TaxID=2589943 RepID=UPI0011284D70|nr:hypothetical protein [Mesorhizobium sp. B2-4-6]TPL49608.1 hypothetical protein FJ957_11040 [Mesorhizobium sp. B2-4-6]